MCQVEPTSLSKTPVHEGPKAIRPRVGWRLGAVLLSHTAVDVYSAFVPPIVGVLQIRLETSATQAAWLIGIGSLASGLSQPLGAWLGDHLDSRRLGTLGLVLAAVCLSTIGAAETYGQLLVLYITGMIGVGIFHPVGASTMGEMSERAFPRRRSIGLSVFFVAGMAGGVIGSVASSRLAVIDGGFHMLAWLMVPGLLLAGLLELAIRTTPHRPDHGAHGPLRVSHSTARWMMIGVLYAGNAVRFTVNVALIYLMVRYAERQVWLVDPSMTKQQIADTAAPIAGSLAALMIVGMAIGGLTTGLTVKPGREKLPLVIIPMVLAPAVALVPFTEVGVAYILAVVTGIAFAATVPVTLGLAQRLQPAWAGVASGLMLGGAWSVAFLGPRLAQMGLDSGLGLERTFIITAVALGASGLIGLLLRPSILRGCAHPEDGA